MSKERRNTNRRFAHANVDRAPSKHSAKCKCFWCNAGAVYSVKIAQRDEIDWSVPFQI